MKPPASRCTAFRALPWIAKANVLGLGAAIISFAVLLWPEWRHDDNMVHGIFLPFLSLILAVESRRDPCPRFLHPGGRSLAGCALLILLGLASVATAIIYAAALGWTYSMAEFQLAAALVFALGAAWLGLADQRVRFLPLNWAAAVAIALWVFASPPPPPSYGRLALFLQTQVTHGVVRTLGAFGIAAYQDGNVIELARTTVGVSEACSGVRSLISCAVAGLFLSALVLRRPSHRLLVILFSPAIGLAMNFLRSLLLTLLANSGVDIEGRWHDLTGGSIIVVTTVLVAAFALWLHRHEPDLDAEGAENPPPTPRSTLPLGMVGTGLLLAAAMAVFFAAASRPVGQSAGRAPDVEAILPAPPRGWTAETTPGLDQYSGTLHTHALVERVYSEGTAPGSARITLYLAYWNPGQASVSLVDAHTPDFCWPGTGWVLEPVANEKTALSMGSGVLPPAECRLFVHNRFETHVWYWHLYGGRPLAIVDPYSATRLLKLGLRYGLGRAGDQLFVRVSSNRPWEEIAAQPTLRQFFENLKPLGL